MNYVTSKARIDQIRRAYMAGPVDPKHLGVTLGLSVITIRKYLKEFEAIGRLYPHKLKDFYFRLPRIKWTAPIPERYTEMITLLPELMNNLKAGKIELVLLWKDYKKLCPEGYSENQFIKYFVAWKRKNNICPYWHRRVRHIGQRDLETLTNWRNSNGKYWKRAVVILDSFQGKPVAATASKIDQRFQLVLKWIEAFKQNGIAALTDHPYTRNPLLAGLVAQKQANIIKLLHQSPAIHGFNRSSWRISDLAAAYQEIYGQRIGMTTISFHLDKLGYGYKKSREVLTSPDPDFREKLQHIKDVLSHLKDNERFFSIDEMGPFSVKQRVGRCFTPKDENRTVPKIQQIKGWLICTAALELSTNQVTHFYSLRKDTGEMLKLLDILLSQYQFAEKLYLSWDAASWHVSKKLKERIILVNSDSYRNSHHSPAVELAPLPASAQFLNVIESVFSGVAKAVLHNSDYASVALCRNAIDNHFRERNRHFLLNPKKAGNKIWGKERVEPVFDETKNCKYHHTR